MNNLLVLSARLDLLTFWTAAVWIRRTVVSAGEDFLRMTKLVEFEERQKTPKHLDLHGQNGPLTETPMNAH